MSKYDNASLVQIPSGYKAGTLYSVLPANGDGDFDFTRASIATRVNAEGLIETVASGVPRLDYPILNGVVQSCPALLLEPARTNVALYSEQLDNASWAGLGLGVASVPVVTANYGVAPDGSQTADRIQFDLNGGTTASDRSIKRQSIASQTDYVISFYVKSNTGTNQKLLFHWGTDSDEFTATSEWQRFTLNKNGTSVAYIGLSLLGSLSSDDTADVLVWGGQAERGSYATSYIPTSGSTVARAAEVCNGAGTASEFNDSEGVLFAEISALANDLTERRMGITGTSSNAARIGYSTTSNQILAVVFNGTNQAVMSYTGADVTHSNKVSLKYKENDFALWVNGFEVATDISGTTFGSGVLNELRFDVVSSNYFYGKTKQLIAFDAALTDEQLEDLTSWDSFEELAASQFYTLY